MVKENSSDSNDLRKKAEVIITKNQGDLNNVIQSVDFLRLQHELQVHQIELEMQNNELLELSKELAESEEKYLNLYKYAPIGYLILNQEGFIQEINLLGSSILGEKQSSLVDRNILVFIEENYLRKFQSLLSKVKKTKTMESCEIMISRTDKKIVYVQLEITMLVEKKLYLLTFLDISARKRTEEELVIKNQAIESSVTAIVITDLDGKITYLNKAYKILLGTKSSRNMVGQLISEAFEGMENINRIVDSLLRNESCNKEIVAKKETLKHKKLYLITSLVCIENNIPKYLMFSIVDLTELSKSQQDLKTSEENYSYLNEFTINVISIYNVDKGKFTFISPTITKLRGVSVEEALDEKLCEKLVPKSYKIINELIKEKVVEYKKNQQKDEYLVYEVQSPCKDGTTKWIETSVKIRTNSHNEVEVVFVSHSIEERKRIEQEILYASYHDQLTGLYNRRFYEEELIRIDSKKNYPIALIMLDINGLKLVNDAFGHLIGDELLKKTADILKQVCKKNEIIARSGGDEFVILLSSTNEVYTRELVSYIYQTIANENHDKNLLSVSIGYSLKTGQNEKMYDVFARAEDDLYRHKTSESLSMRSNTINLIMESLYEKNQREKEHSDRVGEICAAIATAMDFTRDEVNQMRTSGKMHDIGKIGINDSILNKIGVLSALEFEEMKKHSEIGYRILSSVISFASYAPAALEHHERWNGSGYPKGLKGEEISLPARIIAIADSFDAMTSERTYKNAMSTEAAIEEIEKKAGILYDPKLALLFTEKVARKVQ